MLYGMIEGLGGRASRIVLGAGWFGPERMEAVSEILDAFLAAGARLSIRPTSMGMVQANALSVSGCGSLGAGKTWSSSPRERTRTCRIGFPA